MLEAEMTIHVQSQDLRLLLKGQKVLRPLHFKRLKVTLFQKPFQLSFVAFDFSLVSGLPQLTFYIVDLGSLHCVIVWVMKSLFFKIVANCIVTVQGLEVKRV